VGHAQALKALVTPTTRVLDIGTGSGLLALLAARAGAAAVTACEVFPNVARAAQRVVNANGLDHVVKVRSQTMPGSILAVRTTMTYYGFCGYYGRTGGAEALGCYDGWVAGERHAGAGTLDCHRDL